jgi:hypothetical protein
LQIIKTWFYNKTYRNRKPTKRYGKKWTGRDVFFCQNKAECKDQAVLDSGKGAGRPGFITVLQTVISDLFGKLGKKEQDQYEVIAEEWNRRCPSRRPDTVRVMT